MINLKREPGENEDVMMADDSLYPYGTRIDLEDEHLAALSIDPEVGQEVTIKAKAVVVGRNEHESEDHKHESVSFQITDIEVSGATQDAAETLYGVVEVQ